MRKTIHGSSDRAQVLLELGNLGIEIGVLLLHLLNLVPASQLPTNGHSSITTSTASIPTLQARRLSLQHIPMLHQVILLLTIEMIGG